MAFTNIASKRVLCYFTLTSKIRNFQAIIGIIGLGYVGLPLALRFAEVGFLVYGIDIDNSKVNLLRNGKVFNDYGVMCLLKEKYPNLCSVSGRLINKTFKDPRFWPK